jgi:acyl-CoA synthetase (AMP-forming)/AMP-acid ligase II/acyl carrier protein
MSTSAPDPAVRCATLVDLLRAQALETPERLAYTFLRDGEVEDTRLTCAALDAQARAIAAWLQDHHLAGERALLLHPPGLEFISAFFGCLYAGVVAVPAYPPRPNRPDPRIRQIIEDSQASVALTTSAVLAGLQGRLGDGSATAGLRWLATDDVALESGRDWREPEVGPDTLAFLQYTSGSTTTPKGVMVSHRNVLHTSEDLDVGCQHTADTVAVTWLPHFHDLGLIYGIIQPLYKGFPSYVMPPAAFLQRPLRWLQAVSRYGATHSGGPNFAYELCARKIAPEQRAGLDLRRWDVAFNCAEPIRRESLDLFAEAFAPSGFRFDAFCAGYGLAEATVKVTAKRRADPPALFALDAAQLEQGRVVLSRAGEAGTRTLLGCGRAERDTRIVIADPQTLRPCAPDEVGEVWVASTSVARGYWRRPEETARTFGAFLAGTGEGPFLRTGDLGFLVGSELVVTGRIKELIIIRGLNHYPQDIEQTVQGSHPALRPAATAAFSVEVDNEERLVVVQELHRLERNPDVAEITAAIRRAVAEAHDVELQAVVLIRHATILKTSSGKIQRRGCRAAFLEGTLAVVGEWRRPAAAEAAPENGSAPAPRSEADIAGWLAARLARESGIEAEEIDLGQPFASFGLDSARSLQLVGDLEAWLGRRLSPVVLWNYPTVEALARHLGA